MFYKILIPLDGSPRGEKSLPWAHALFRGAEIVLMHVLPPPCTCGCSRVIPDAAAAADYLSKTAAGLQGAAKTIVQEGPPAHTILNTAIGVGADLIAITTHGATNPAAPMIGGIAEQLIYGSHLPLLVVPSPGTFPSPVRPLKNILVPLDGTQAGEAMLPFARRMAQELEMGLVLAHVLTEPVRSAYLESLHGRMHDAKTVKIIVRHGKLPETLLDIARDESADLAALCSHAYGRLPRLLFGSVSGKLVRAAWMPVLLAKHAALKRLTGRETAAATR